MTETRSITIAGDRRPIGPLTLLQVRSALAAYTHFEGFIASGDIRRITPEALAVLADALAAFSGLDAQKLERLPLDQFVTAVTDTAEAVIAANAAYLTGPVEQALQKLSAALASQALLQPAPAGAVR